MRRAQRDSRFQVVAPLRFGRAGNSEDQVQRPPRKPRADDLEGRFNLAGAVFTLEDRQQPGLKRLGPQADPVDAGFEQDVGLFLVNRPRVGLDREFTAGGKNEPPVDQDAQRVQLGRIEPGGCASSHEDRIDFLGPLQGSLDLAFERPQVLICQVIDARQRGKVAVSALVGAERNVHVGRSRPSPAGLA